MPLSGIPARHRLWRVLTLKNAPTPSLFNAINKGGQLFQVPGTSCLAPFCQETPPALLPPPSSSPWLLSLFLPISVIWDPTRLPEPSSKESGTLHRRFVPKFCCEICSASSVSFWCLFFNFCSVKKNSPGKMNASGPQTHIHPTTMGTIGGSTARRSSPTPTSQGF